MLELLRRWWFAARCPQSWDAVRLWGASQGWAFKPTREHDGFVIEPTPPATWRLEWGPSHRAYLGSRELRLRADIGIDPMSYAVVMPRGLIDGLERELFSAITESTQTRVDDALPPEVRWLAMSERLHASDLGPLQPLVGAVGNVRPWLCGWLAGPTGQMLVDLLGPRGLGLGAPLSLILQQGQLVLRVGMPEPDAAQIADWVRFFEMARAEAARVAALPADSVGGLD